MSKKKMLTISILLFFICVWSIQMHSMSAGAMALTGAPQENNCTGCHSGVADSDNKGAITISVAGNPTHYNAGQTYDINVTVHYTGRTRFGFALNVRKKGVLFLPVGELLAAEGSGVRVNSYATHESTSIDANNSKTWTFKWTAPQTMDTIVFYAGGIASDNNKLNTGDLTYTTSKTLLPGAKTAVTVIDVINWRGVFPNPTRQDITLLFDVQTEDNYQIALLDLKGEVKEILTRQTLSVGEQQLNLKLANQYPTGIYIIQIVSHNYNTYKKIIIL